MGPRRSTDRVISAISKSWKLLRMISGCLEIGKTQRWQVRVYDSSPVTKSFGRLETTEIEFPYVPLSLNTRVRSARVYKDRGKLTPKLRCACGLKGSCQSRQRHRT